MVKRIDFRQVIDLQGQGAQLVEVLPRDEYDELHIQGAASLPLEELNSRSAWALDRSRPVVVYCQDAL